MSQVRGRGQAADWPMESAAMSVPDSTRVLHAHSLTQSDLFCRSTSTFVFDGNPSGDVPVNVTSSNTIITNYTAEPVNTMAARAAALFRSRPNQWIDGREFAQACGYAGWRTRISDIRRAPFNMEIENRQYREGRYVVSEYRWNADVRGDAR